MNPLFRLMPQLLDSFAPRRNRENERAPTALDLAEPTGGYQDCDDLPGDRPESNHFRTHSPSTRHDHPAARVRGHETTRSVRRRRSRR